MYWSKKHSEINVIIQKKGSGFKKLVYGKMFDNF